MSSVQEPNYVLEDAVINVFLYIYGTILASGLMLCSTHFLAMYRGRKILFQSSFYRIVLSLLVLDTFSLVHQVVLIFPSMVVDDWGIDSIVKMVSANKSENVSHNPTAIRFGLSMLEFLPMKGLLSLILLMALNRLTVFSFTSLKFLFNKDIIARTLAGCWAVIALLCTTSVLVRPIQSFNRTRLQFEDCGEAFLHFPVLRTAITKIDYCVPFLIMAIYIVIYLSIKKERRKIKSSSTSRSANADDTRILWQAIVIAVFLQLCNVALILAEMVDESRLIGYILNMSSLICSVTNHSIHSTIFIMTNSAIKSFLPQRLQMLCCRLNAARATAPSKYSNHK